MSRMIAEAGSLGRYGQIRRIYQTALCIFLGLGVAGTVLMTGFCRPLANWMNSPNSWAAIAALGPSALLMCLTSAFRGFFQGQGNMRPTSVSQVLEAVCKLVVGLGLAWFIMKQKNDTALAAGGAILGVTSGCLIATLYMYGAYSRARPGNAEKSGRRFLFWSDGQATSGHCDSHHHRLGRTADHHPGGCQGGHVPAHWGSRVYPGAGGYAQGCVQLCTDHF